MFNAVDKRETGQYGWNDDPREDWNAKGEGAFGAGNLDEAVRCFEKALLFNPFDAKAHSNLGVTYLQKGKMEDALNSIVRALELNPDDQDVIVNCSRVFQILGRADDAREVLQAYLKRNPWDREVREELELIMNPSQEPRVSKTADFFNEQGEIRFHRGRLDHARACFEMAIEDDPLHGTAHGNLGVVYWHEGELQKALEHLLQALDLKPDEPEILFNSYKVLVAVGETDVGADMLKNYLQRCPQDETAWKEYAGLLMDTGAGSWKPNGLPIEAGATYIEMGRQLAEVGDLQGAADAIQRAMAIDPERPEAYHLLGQLHMGLEQHEEAAAILREGLKRDPEYKASRQMLESILTSQETEMVP